MVVDGVKPGSDTASTAEPAQKPLVVAAIPAYNEERTIAKIILQTSKCVDRVVVCDDGSQDLTGDIARRLGADVVRHETNLGYGAAIQRLFRKAKELNAEVLVTINGDGQHDPGEIPVVVEPVLQGKADIVVGSRTLGDARKRTTRRRRRSLGNQRLPRVTGAGSNNGVTDTQSGFRCYNRRALKRLGLYEWGMSVNGEILMEAEKHGLAVAEVPTRGNGVEFASTVTPGSLTQGVSAAKSMVRRVVETKLFVFLGIPGAISLVAGVFFGVWLLQMPVLERQIATNLAVASIAFILIGLFAILTAIMLYAISGLIQTSTNPR